MPSNEIIALIAALGSAASGAAALTTLVINQIRRRRQGDHINVNATEDRS